MLEYKIKQLKESAEPQTQAINKMQQQIQEIDKEIVNYQKKNKLSFNRVEHLKQKQKTLTNMIARQRQQLLQQQQQHKQLKNKIIECAQYLQDPVKLKQKVAALCCSCSSSNSSNNSNSSSSSSNSNSSSSSSNSNSCEADITEINILKEQTRQRDYLEKSIECLKKRFYKDSSIHRQDNIKLMKDNAVLIQEINELRREIFALSSSNRIYNKNNNNNKQAAKVNTNNSNNTSSNNNNQ